MADKLTSIHPDIPPGLHPYFQEYNVADLDHKRDADLIIQRTLEYGTWEEIQWLFISYGGRRIRSFLKQHGERWLRPVDFYYWRKLLRVRKWQHSPFPTPTGELWNP